MPRHEVGIIRLFEFKRDCLCFVKTTIDQFRRSNNAIVHAPTSETIPLVKVPVRLSPGSRINRRMRMLVSSLCNTRPCAACRIVAKGDPIAQCHFIHTIFGVVA